MGLSAAFGRGIASRAEWRLQHAKKGPVCITFAARRASRACSTHRCYASVSPVIAAKSFDPNVFYIREPASWPTELELPLKAHDLHQHGRVDVVVAGAGPAGVAVAERVSQAGFRVCVVDPDPLGVWPNNYGTWVDDFQAMGLEDCLEVIWPKAKVWLDNSATGEK
jgi:Lycopene cyclase protein